MRKTSLIFLGAIAGAGLVLGAQPRIRRITRRSGALGHIPAAQPVRRNIRAGTMAYVEKPDDNKLVQSAINGMLAGLDPHSSYMDPNGLRDIQVQTRGEYGGLGIEVTMEGA